MTTQDQKDKVEAFVEKVKTIPGVYGAYIDDFGRFGNFAVIITRKSGRDAFINGRKVNFRHIIPVARKYAREAGLIWRENEVSTHPRRKYDNYVDIDCQLYHAESNTFASQEETETHFENQQTSLF